MRLRIVTPDAIAVDAEAVSAVHAEDATGAFGILPRHADFLTVLVPSVVGWRTEAGEPRWCAVRGGLLTVNGGEAVEIATREAVTGDDLAALQKVVTGQLVRNAQAEKAARAHAEQLRLQAIRQIVGYLRAGVDQGRAGGRR